MAHSKSTKDHGNRIFLWFNPRSLSSVFIKCVSCMDGAQTWFEPYTACFLNSVFSTPEYLAKFPKIKKLKGKIEGTTQEIDDLDHCLDGGTLTPSSYFNYDWVQEQLEKPMADGKSFMFVKEAAACVDGFYDKLPRIPFRHTFIIRDPYKVAMSARTLYKYMLGYDVDLDSFDMYESNPFLNWDRISRDPLYSLWKYVKETYDSNPVVIDADDLQNYPDQILRKYCEAVGIPYKEKYLQWPKSDKPLKYCYGPLDQMVCGKINAYKTAFASSHFQPTSGVRPAFEDLTPDSQRYVKDMLPGYEEMFFTRIKPDI